MVTIAIAPMMMRGMAARLPASGPGYGGARLLCGGNRISNHDWAEPFRLYLFHPSHGREYCPAGGREREFRSTQLFISTPGITGITFVVTSISDERSWMSARRRFSTQRLSNPGK